jgi:2-polyprenyl-3-methyl-5-hydroxy-6-metoxy-1,4-benzoquinol methylase
MSESTNYLIEALSSIETAHRRASAAGVTNARFETAELDTFETAQMFDAVIGRPVLLYQRDPSATLRCFLRFLRLGGLAAFQQMDMQLPLQVFTT